MTGSASQNDVAVAVKWWRDLTMIESRGRLSRGSRRAALARLRRATTPIEAMLEPEALRLIAGLSGSGGRFQERAAVLAGVLATVREEERRPVARALGRSSLDDPESARMSESRFRRLLQADDEELMDAMRRLVGLAGGRVDVYDLSHAILYWGDRVKKRWIFRYYNVEESLRPATDGSPGQPHTLAT